MPSELAKDLERYKLKRWDVTRRIQRMNRKLRRELDQTAAEKHGQKWALTSFMHNIWASPDESQIVQGCFIISVEPEVATEGHLYAMVGLLIAMAFPSTDYVSSFRLMFIFLGG